MRRAAGLTQAQLAERLGVSNGSWVSHRETGHVQRIPVDEIQAWAEACGQPAQVMLAAEEVVQYSASEDARNAANMLVSAWPHLSDAERGMLTSMLRIASDRGR